MNTDDFRTLDILWTPTKATHTITSNPTLENTLTLPDIKDIEKQQEKTRHEFKSFEDWRKTRYFPDNLSYSDRELDHIASCFVSEARRVDRTIYPPRTMERMET